MDTPPGYFNNFSSDVMSRMQAGPDAVKAVARLRSAFWFILVAMAASPVSAATLPSGSVELAVQPAGAVRFSFSHSSTPEFQASQPVCLQLLTESGTTCWLSHSYSSVTSSNGCLHCASEIRTPSGSVFEFSDTFQPGPQAGIWELDRDVAVRQAARADVGFLTRFSLCAPEPQPLNHYDVFIPGIWYADNRNVPANSLAADLSGDYYICREDRMPLPLVMMRDKAQGITLTLIHLHPDGATCLADYTPARIVDSRVRVASLGIFGQANAAAAFYYPAAEGEHSYLLNRGRTKGWVERFHPVRPGVTQSCRMLLALSQTPDFPEAMKQAWRLGFEQIHPSAAQVDLAASYEASIRLIAHWSRTTRGAPGVPFRLRLPQGELEDEEKINYQMGFVGQQIPLAYHLLRYGLRHTNESFVEKGEATVDFWATNALTAAGLPHTWFNTWPEPHWRNENTFIRVASDGMVGALMAYDVLAAAGRRKEEWLTFCCRFGDWLVARQNSDGSWYREYKLDSMPAHAGKQNTCDPIPYLVDLYTLTGNRGYLNAALRAGDWCWTNVHESFCYVGGTVDNPNVTDKEAGFLALGAFLALHDATGDDRWLKAAAQAADFTETWAYCWNVPIPADDSGSTFPHGATATGFSLIACGQSGADLFLAGAPFYFYRLYLETGDAHYADMARQFLYNPRQSVDINGSLGYGFPGLCTEALSLAPPRGHGVNAWLPWLTYSMLEPMVRLEDAYGTMDLPAVDTKQRPEMLAKDQVFGRTRGLLSVNATAAK